MNHSSANQNANMLGVLSILFLFNYGLASEDTQNPPASAELSATCSNQLEATAKPVKISESAVKDVIKSLVLAGFKPSDKFMRDKSNSDGRAGKIAKAITGTNSLKAVWRAGSKIHGNWYKALIESEVEADFIVERKLNFWNEARFITAVKSAAEAGFEPKLKFFQGDTNGPATKFLSELFGRNKLTGEALASAVHSYYKEHFPHENESPWNRLLRIAGIQLKPKPAQILIPKTKFEWTDEIFIFAIQSISQAGIDPHFNSIWADTDGPATALLRKILNSPFLSGREFANAVQKHFRGSWKQLLESASLDTTYMYKRQPKPELEFTEAMIIQGIQGIINSRIQPLLKNVYSDYNGPITAILRATTGDSSINGNKFALKVRKYFRLKNPDNKELPWNQAIQLAGYNPDDVL